MTQAMKNLNLLQKMLCHSQTAKGKDIENDSIKFETGSINSNLCNYSDTFLLVAGDITIQMLHLKIVHNFLHARHKPMMFLMMKQIIFTLQCLCTI